MQIIEDEPLIALDLEHLVLAIVQSIAAQTARSETSLAQFTTRFNARLMALASTHTTLSNSDWAAANVRELIMAQITTTLGDAAGSEIDGPDATLSAQTAIQLGLVLCELASNARWHGALSRAGETRVDKVAGRGAGTRPQAAY